MIPIRIDVGTATRSYPVFLGSGLIDELPSLLSDARLGAGRFIVSSPQVWKFHGRALAAALPGAPVILIPDGERFKHLQTVSRIYDGLVQAGADRTAALLAIGGGVVGDVAGFAAATYLRGVTLVQIPTTLLAQVDSAIGAKVGVNHPLGKNLIGAFHAPALVAIDPLMLSTLPRREFRAGLYEVVKYGMIASRDLFDRVSRDLDALFARRADVLLPIITECCQIKASIVSDDEREHGPRRRLNFGHTAGHALEAITKYRRFRHGEAIGYGMLVAAHIAVARGIFSEADRQALSTLITQMGPLPPVRDLTIPPAIEAIRRDKKVVAGTLHFVLASSIGSTTIVDDVTEDELEDGLRAVGLQ